ncbi:FAD dependent oxidoreductase-like protein superfamily [Amniculicola lignicola CBS 123094]|uniref:FAD dependent oxidoreductase-like protein superfamily n=1 Tax=Amniculicola lignicola CBS 123094 TaxID=1392246 RepID=A0A6A5WG69_9PLEO|nr:FAD dependent oxidoreductase-like protein superfamily [Amniculicola lignicola CBS 123094]
MSESDSLGTFILGSGIIGLSTAYYLSQEGSTTKAGDIHLVDSSPELFHCASGFAGGFLAENWFAPSVASLGALSFKLHKELADKYNGRRAWGYRPSTGLSYNQDSESAIEGSGEDWLRDGTSRMTNVGSREELNDNKPAWLKKDDGASLDFISEAKSTAQIDPARFCQFLQDECVKRGVQFHYPARAIFISKSADRQVNGIRLSENGTETEIPCTRIIITAGAWSPYVFATLFPQATTRIPVASLAGHSLLISNPFNKMPAESEVCRAVFATDTVGFSPEWFERAGDQEAELYLAGLNSTVIPLPETATDAKPLPEAMKQLTECAAVMLRNEEGKDMKVIREALCFRPVTSSGRPLVCRIPDHKLGNGIKTRSGSSGGVFVAAGHGAWGISQAPGTGLCLAELIEGKEPSASLKALELP